MYLKFICDIFDKFIDISPSNKFSLSLIESSKHNQIDRLMEIHFKEIYRIPTYWNEFIKKKKNHFKSKSLENFSTIINTIHDSCLFLNHEFQI